MKNSIMKELTMFILFTLAEIVLSITWIVLAITIDQMLYIGITLLIIFTIIYICLIVWSPISPFFKLVFDNQGFIIIHFKKIKERIDWNELSNISYEFQGRIGYYTFTFKTKRKAISIAYEKRLRELILSYCTNSYILENIQQK